MEWKSDCKNSHGGLLTALILLFAIAYDSVIKMTKSEAETVRVDKQLRASLTKPVEIDNEIENLQKKDKGNKAIIALFQNKIDMLYKELQTLQLEYNKMYEYSKEVEIENKKHCNNQVKLHNQIETLNDTITKLESINSDTLLNYQALNNENTALKKDLEGLNKTVQSLNQQVANYELKLNRSIESNKKFKNILKYNQIEEKELRNQIRILQEDKKLTIKNLEKERSELVQVLKKQMLLLDNLKKQNVFLLTSGQICLMKEDFTKLLAWKPQQV
ncbi:myosin-13-like isoform X2 [Pseudomyrmex gracilis]|uniref:myosin-13-like isoform X2 n=1 Tax=Pseudomyrmex gracilis TaxID=219809 RepID=UPI000994B65C|nr:myosin-13-like isoform X2 [Pseudomyrmex gracilis]